MRFHFVANRGCHESEPRRNLDASLEFGMRSKRDAHVVCVRLRATTTVTLSHVRGNRYRRASKLTGQSVQFFSRKVASLFVEKREEVQRDLPRREFSVGGI